jgi:hypothetical protein
MGLPVFRYHPDPIASGSIIASDAQCVCCGARRGFIYVSSVYCVKKLRNKLCPWCIADGSAHATFDASFNDPDVFPDNIAREIVAEVAYRTPGFDTWQQETWLTCCGDAAAFLEAVGYAEIRARYPQAEEVLIKHCVEELGFARDEALRIVREFDLKCGPTAYVFSCRHCDGLKAYFDFT